MEIAIKDREARKAKARKLPRSAKERKRLAAIEEAVSRPDRPDEKRLLTILASAGLKHRNFHKTHLLPVSDRAFVCEALKIRVLLNHRARGRTGIVRREIQTGFDWVVVKLTADGVMKEASFVAALLKEVCAEQERLQVAYGRAH